MRPCPFALSIPVGIAALLTPPSLSQINAVELARVGDSISGGASVTGFHYPRVNDSGRWAVIVETDSTTSRRRLFLDDVQILAEGDPAPNVPGETVEAIRAIDLADTGRLAVLTELSSGFAVYVDGELVLESFDIASLPGFGPSARYTVVGGLALNANDQLLLNCGVFEPGGGPLPVSCLVRLELGSGGAVLSETLLGQRGDVYPGQTAPLFAFVPGENTMSFGDDGLGTWTGILASAAPGLHVAYENATIPMYQGNQPAFLGGADYLDLPLAATAYNDVTGSRAHSAKLDVGANPDDGIIIRDGAVYAREGANLTAFPGAPVIETLGFENLALTDDSDIVFYAQVDNGSPFDEAIVRGSDLMLPKGAMIVGGQRITDLADVPSGFHVSDSGQFLLAQAELDNQSIGLVYVQDEIGESYCAAENNSTGVPSVTAARGVGLATANALILETRDGPPGAFAFYIVSMTSDNVPNPGGSAGRLCIGGSIGRHLGGLGQIDAGGVFRFQPDLTRIPTTPNVAVQPGETWHWQQWHRDSTPTGGSTSNFSLPVRVTFH